MLSVDSVSLILSGKTILQDIQLRIEAGERIALVGASGSGKTSLLRVLAGMLRPSQGQVQMNGEQVYGFVDKLVPGHAHIALVHQDFQLAHRMSVLDNIRQKLRHLPVEQQEAEAMRLLQVCRLQAQAKRAVELLSGGEKQRLALARALADEPQLLLFDEPFSNLDPPLKESLKDDLLEILEETQLACLWVTHEPADALSLSMRLYVLEAGKLVQSGDPKQVYNQPISISVARLFGRCAWLFSDALPTAWQRQLRQEQRPGKAICLRPEHLSITVVSEEEDGQTGRLHYCRFVGPAYICALKVAGIDEMLYAYSRLPYAEGQLVGLRLNC